VKLFFVDQTFFAKIDELAFRHVTAGANLLSMSAVSKLSSITSAMKFDKQKITSLNNFFSSLFQLCKKSDIPLLII